MRATERPCYIHIGTHKTGTTSIQRFLAVNRERLAAAGVVLPRSGCDNHPEFVSHHQIAYELTENPLFDARYGGLESLVEELTDSHARAACLSSEDFSRLWHNPVGLRRLRETILRAGYRPLIVCYLRPQASFSTSIYAHIVCNGGLRISFADFLQTVLTRGRYAWGANLGTPFDYAQLLDPFVEIFGSSSIVVRRYRPAAPSTHILAEFAQLLVPSGMTKSFTLPTVRQNPSLGFTRVLEALGLPHLPLAPIRFAPLKLRDVAAFGVRFRAGNAALTTRYGIALPAFESMDIALALPCRRSLAKTRALTLARRALASRPPGIICAPEPSLPA